MLTPGILGGHVGALKMHTPRVVRSAIRDYQIGGAFPALRAAEETNLLDLYELLRPLNKSLAIVPRAGVLMEGQRRNTDADVRVLSSSPGALELQIQTLLLGGEREVRTLFMNVVDLASLSSGSMHCFAIINEDQVTWNTLQPDDPWRFLPA